MTDTFHTATPDLPAATRSDPADVADGDDFQPRIAPASERIGADTVRMLASNGSIPGPTQPARAEQRSGAPSAS